MKENWYTRPLIGGVILAAGTDTTGYFLHAQPIPVWLTVVACMLCSFGMRATDLYFDRKRDK